jgi:hypothetical protein
MPYLPITSRPGPATANARTGRGEPLFRLAAAWRACPRTEGAGAAQDSSALFGSRVSQGAEPVFQRLGRRATIADR